MHGANNRGSQHTPGRGAQCLSLMEIHSTNQHDRPTKLASDTDGSLCPQLPPNCSHSSTGWTSLLHRVPPALVYGRAIPRVARHNPGRAHPRTYFSRTNAAPTVWSWPRRCRDRHERPPPAAGPKGRFSFRIGRRPAGAVGVEPGSVTPFAAINDVAGKVAIVLDAAMLPMRF